MFDVIFESDCFIILKGGQNMAELSVLNKKISYIKIENEDYISITDMLKSKDGDFFVSD